MEEKGGEEGVKTKTTITNLPHVPLLLFPPDVRIRH